MSISRITAFITILFLTLLSTLHNLDAQEIDLELELSTDASLLTIGDQFTYSILVTNTSLTEATGVTVDFELPDNVIYNSSVSNNGFYSPANSLWTIGTIAANESSQLDVTVEAYLEGSVESYAQVWQAEQTDLDSTPGNYAEQPDEDDSDLAQVNILPSSSPLIDLSLSLSTNLVEAQPGEAFVIEMEVQNQGPDDATSLQVEFNLPEILELIDTESFGIYTPGTSTWALSYLSAGASSSLYLTVSCAVIGEVTGSAQVITVGAQDIDSSPNNDDGDQSEDDEDNFSILITGLECSQIVWPGDSNNDGICNNYDLLNVGIAYGSTGPARLNPVFTWQEQEAECWDDEFLNGINYNHADGIGDGVIDQLDQLAIEQNYGLTNGEITVDLQDTDEGPELYYVEPEAELTEGTYLSLPVYLGTEDEPVEALYGMAFTIHFNQITFQPGTFEVSFEDCWLGTEQLDMITLDQLIQPEYKAEIALVRNDQTERGGYGKICTIHGMIDDIAGKQESNYSFETSSPRAINGAEEVLSIKIVPQITTLVESSDGPNFEAYPNPAKQVLSLLVSDARYQQYQLLDCNGALHRQGDISSEKTTIDISALAEGIYWIACTGPEGPWVESVLILR